MVRSVTDKILKKGDFQHKTTLINTGLCKPLDDFIPMRENGWKYIFESPMTLPYIRFPQFVDKTILPYFCRP